MAGTENAGTVAKFRRTDVHMGEAGHTGLFLDGDDIPATICLAIAFYEQLQKLRQHLLAIFVGVLGGTDHNCDSVLRIDVNIQYPHSLFPFGRERIVGFNLCFVEKLIIV